MKKNRITFTCDNCGILSESKSSAYARKKRHFCSQKCYSKFRKNKLPYEEQHAYKGIRLVQESKQIYHKRYVKTHKELISHLKARRYARERNASGSHTLLEWQQLKKRFENRCAYCRKKTKLTKDHIIPLSEGGSDYISNIQPLCRNCNSKKWKHIYENPELVKK